MIGFYSPLLILQAFCLYHAYSNRAEQRWYWLIVLFPGIGCAIYLYHSFYNRRSIETIAEGVKGVVNSNYKIEQLEKALRFSDNVTNKVNLADAYAANGRYDEALALYQECLTGFMADDPVIRIKVLFTSYLKKDYPTVVTWGQQLESETRFKKAEERAAYAWALHYTGRTAEAEKVFIEMDSTFTNYRQRIEYCKFLKATGKTEALKSKLQEMNEELEHLKGPERKFYRHIGREIRELQNAEKA
ncbi:tetratricopeptide repeat protein [Ohtaekwangia sp.]|uniref:tetratricopeptide repeat protein n=1 Tax=Ohtaekwangia sp. TaxID=2066019 RepID=UPI002FDE28A7